jgi:HTH-like domain
MPDDDLVAAIRGLLAASPFHGEGYRKIWARLRFAGIRTSKRRVLRLMRASNLPLLTTPTFSPKPRRMPAQAALDIPQLDQQQLAGGQQRPGFSCTTGGLT